MFGSRNLLIAFFIGNFGIALLTGTFASELPAGKVASLAVGLCLLWMSALFGPIMFMKDRGIKGTADQRENNP